MSSMKTSIPRRVPPFCQPRGRQVPENQRLLPPQSQSPFIAFRWVGYDCENIRMSTFNAKCPNCSLRCDVPSTYINQEVKCPSCAETFVAEPCLPAHHEPCLDLPAPPIKAPPPNAPSAPLPEGHYIGIFGKYATGISKSEPLFHRFLRYAAMLAMVLWFQNVIALFGDDSEIEGWDRIVLLWNGLISVMLLWGSAQLVQFFHSIAWNTQEARRARSEL